MNSIKKYKVIYPDGNISSFYGISEENLRTAMLNTGFPDVEIIETGIYTEYENLPLIKHTEKAAN